MARAADKANPSGDTVFDVMMAAMRELPLTPASAYDKAFNQLSVENASNIRGIYGESATFKRLRTEELVPGAGLYADPTRLKIGSSVDYSSPGQQGVDIESVLEVDELVSVSLKTQTKDGTTLFVEVKNYTSNYSVQALKKQTKKHFEANIAGLIEDDSWRDLEPPHLHYEWMGEGFVNPDTLQLRADLIERRKQAVLEVCETLVAQPPFVNVRPKFDCARDITFNIVPHLIAPLNAR